MYTLHDLERDGNGLAGGSSRDVPFHYGVVLENRETHERTPIRGEAKQQILIPHKNYTSESIFYDKDGNTRPAYFLDHVKLSKINVFQNKK